MKNDLALLLVTIFKSVLSIFIPGRRDLEILMLRKEIQVLRRQTQKPKFSRWDRLFFISIFRANSKTIQNIVSIQPSTVISWHWKLVKKKWTYSSKKSRRPPITKEIKNLILEMKGNTRRWGCRKIEGELRKLGIEVSKSAIQKIPKLGGYHPGKFGKEESWLSFLRSHTSRYFACDFLTVETAFLNRHYGCIKSRDHSFQYYSKPYGILAGKYYSI